MLRPGRNARGGVDGGPGRSPGRMDASIEAITGGPVPGYLPVGIATDATPQEFMSSWERLAQGLCAINPGALRTTVCGKASLPRQRELKTSHLLPGDRRILNQWKLIGDM